MKRILLSIYFQIGVNIIGLPEFHKINTYTLAKELKEAKGSKYHK